MKSILFEPLFIISSFFNSILNNTKNIYFRFLIHLIYVIPISIIYGMFFSLYFVVLITIFTGWEPYFIGQSIYSGILLFFFLLFFTILKKREDRTYNLPVVLIHTFELIRYLIKTKVFLKVLIYIFVSTFIFMVFFSSLVFSFRIPQQYSMPIIFTIFFVSLTLSIIFVNVYKTDTLTKMIKQLFLLFYLTITFLVLTVSRLFYYSYSNNIVYIEISFLLISFVLSFFPLLKLTNSVYIEFCNRYASQLENIWFELNKKYNYKLILNRIDKERSQLKEGFSSIQNEWKSGRKKEVIKRLFTAIMLITLMWTIVFNMDDIIIFLTPYLDILIEFIKKKWISFFNNEQQATTAFVLLVFVIILLWNLTKIIMNFGVLNRIEKLSYINRILFSLIIIVTLTYATLQVTLQPAIAFVLMLLFLIIYIIYKVIEKENRR